MERTAMRLRIAVIGIVLGAMVLALGPNFGRFIRLPVRENHGTEKIVVVIATNASNLGDLSFIITYKGRAFFGQLAEVTINGIDQTSRLIEPGKPYSGHTSPANPNTGASYREEISFWPFRQASEGSTVVVNASIPRAAYAPQELSCTILLVGRDPDNTMAHYSTLKERASLLKPTARPTKEPEELKNLHCSWLIHRTNPPG